MKEMVESDDHRHLSLRGLALYAQRIGRVVASPWSRLVPECGWRRPRCRVYPAKPKVGIRADASNELWHIDVTIIRLLGSTENVNGSVDALLDREGLRRVQAQVEVNFGNGDAVVIDLAAARVRARQERMKANRMAACGICAGGPDFGALQLQRAERGMS